MNHENDKRTPIFLKPSFTHTIWGSTVLRDVYGYDEPGDDIGECWGISAHPQNDNVVADGEYAGMHLSGLWQAHPELFGRTAAGSEAAAADRGSAADDAAEDFPLLVKIISAGDDLSIQVHPDDAYAAAHEAGSRGKSECWYVLGAEPGSRLVIGHKAQTREELHDMIEQGRWDELIGSSEVAPGDYVQITPGTVHAICGGVTLIETQQSSDITYRLYDYDRLQGGKPRQLHIRQAEDVITVPSPDISGMVRHDTSRDDVSRLISCEYYEVYRIRCRGSLETSFDRPFMLMSVVVGSGEIAVREASGPARAIVKGDHFILPSGCCDIEIRGDLTIIASCLPEV